MVDGETFGVQEQSKIGGRWISSCFLKTEGGHMQ